MMYELRKTYCSDNADCSEPTTVEKIKEGDYEEIIKTAKDLISKDIDADYNDLYLNKKPETKEYTYDGYYSISYTIDYEEYGYDVTKKTDHKIGESWSEGGYQDYFCGD